MGTTTRQTTRAAPLNFPTGTITFTLTGPNLLAVDTETVTVNGNGDYTTPTGFALTAGTLAGTYSWTATYSGGPNNNAAIANSENVTVAAPTLTTAAKSQRHPFGRQRHAQRQCDPFWRIQSHRGYRITLTGPGGFLFTQTDAVSSGNGTYTAAITLPTAGTVVGTYSWTAHYSGDGNNIPANDQGTPPSKRRFLPLLLASARPPRRKALLARP